MGAVSEGGERDRFGLPSDTGSRPPSMQEGASFHLSDWGRTEKQAGPRSCGCELEGSSVVSAMLTLPELSGRWAISACCCPEQRALGGGGQHQDRGSGHSLPRLALGPPLRWQNSHEE